MAVRIWVWVAVEKVAGVDNVFRSESRLAERGMSKGWQLDHVLKGAAEAGGGCRRINGLHLDGRPQRRVHGCGGLVDAVNAMHVRIGICAHELCVWGGRQGNGAVVVAAVVVVVIVAESVAE
jgi:hypothetical protein